MALISTKLLFQFSSMEFLQFFLRLCFGGKTALASKNVGCFHGLIVFRVLDYRELEQRLVT